MSSDGWIVAILCGVTAVGGLAARRGLAVVALLAATVVWGSTFLVTKQSLPGLAPAPFLTWRFGIAAAVLLAFRPGAVGALTSVERRRAVVLGVLLGSGFLLQTVGLQSTAAGVSGFLTGTAVLLTPVVAALVFGERVGLGGWAAVGLSTVGIGLLAGAGTSNLTVGALLTLAGAVCFAGHITGLSQWATRANAYGMTALSVLVAAALAATTAGVTHQLALPPNGTSWRAVAYLALVATCLGFVVQAWAQSALPATTAAVVMTMEPVFAAALAVGVGAEALVPSGWIGGLLIVVAMFLAELGPRACCDAMSPRIDCC